MEQSEELSSCHRAAEHHTSFKGKTHSINDVRDFLLGTQRTASCKEEADVSDGFPDADREEKQWSALFI